MSCLAMLSRNRMAVYGRVSVSTRNYRWVLPCTHHSFPTCVWGQWHLFRRNSDRFSLPLGYFPLIQRRHSMLVSVLSVQSGTAPTLCSFWSICYPRGGVWGEICAIHTWLLITQDKFWIEKENDVKNFNLKNKCQQPSHQLMQNNVWFHAAW